jgi:hypothetical protein
MPSTSGAPSRFNQENRGLSHKGPIRKLGDDFGSSNQCRSRYHASMVSSLRECYIGN